jgi:formate C-acetyltransferase
MIDDCIDRGLDFNAGGARHCWSVVNVAGLINAIDSLLAVRELVYREKAFSPGEFAELLENEDGALYRRLQACPCYGADDPDADALAAQAACDIWESFDGKTPWLGGAFLPSSIQFATYADAGRDVGPTPDGRKRGDPLCDSVSAIRGRDAGGPTAMLASAARLHLDKALGTPVTNLRLSREHVGKALKPLVQGYFRQGGMQLQITCASKADMLEALARPQEHKSLIVRIGGYSEYFNNLSPELKQTVIDRTEF